MFDSTFSRSGDGQPWVVESILLPGGVSGELLRPDKPDPMEAHALRIETTTAPPTPDMPSMARTPWVLATRSSAPETLAALWGAVRMRFAFDPARIEVPPGIAVESFAKVELRVGVPRVRKRRGILVASVFTGPQGFPSDGKRAAGVATLDLERMAEAEPMVLDVAGIVPGPVAIALLHDENRNGKLDSALGFPTEGFGFSGSPKIRFGPPRFEACRFLVTPAAPRRELDVTIVYL